MSTTPIREMQVLVSGESENATKMNLRAGKFRLVIDEPKQMGGTES